MRGWFVTGTDTGVGKTVVAAAIAAALRRSGHPVSVHKPLLTGLDEPPDPVWPRDHELLAAAARCQPDEVAAVTWGPAVSPHLAAELSDARVPPSHELAEGIAARAGADAVTIVEGVGGLLVPLAEGENVRDLAAAVGLPLIVVARPGLGTINHTLLTLEAARSRELSVAGVVLNPWPAEPDVLARSNLETIELRGGVAVSCLARIERPDPAVLAAAGSRLPLGAWLAAQPAEPGR